MQQLMGSLKSESLRLEFVSLLQTLAVWQAAETLSVNRVVMPDYAESLANASFNALCFGRCTFLDARLLGVLSREDNVNPRNLAPSLGEMTKVVDARHPQVELIRPLREVCEKEIHLVNEFEHSDEYALNPSAEPARYRPGEGIQPLTSNFISDLQSSGFPATITTILSVSTKVEPREKGDRKCRLCYTSFLRPAEKEGIDGDTTDYYCAPCTSILSEAGPLFSERISSCL